MQPLLLAESIFEKDGYGYQIRLYKDPTTGQYLINRRWGSSSVIQSLVWEATNWGGNELVSRYDGKVRQKQRYGLTLIRQTNNR